MKPHRPQRQRQLCWLCGVAARARHGAGACCAWFRWLLPGMLRPQHYTAPTRTDAGALSAAKTPAFRPLNYDAATATASISLKDLTDTWQAQIAYLQEATVSGNLKEQGARLPIRAHAQPLPISCASDCDGAVRLTVMVRSLCR